MTPKLTPFYEISRSDYIGGQGIPRQVMATRFTDRSIWIYGGTTTSGELIEKKVRREGAYDGYYPTLELALAMSRNILKGRMKGLEEDVERSLGRLKKAKEWDKKFSAQQKSGKSEFIGWINPDKMSRDIEV